MRSQRVSDLLEKLGVRKSHSRPHVSDDNPYSESHFKTLKYQPGYPDRFGSIEDARAFCQRFFGWYNYDHYHSGICWLTPATVHEGLAERVLADRHDLLLKHYVLHPERFRFRVPRRPHLPAEVWINKPLTASEAEPFLDSKSNGKRNVTE